ncbi:HNH endonuclease [Ferrimonas balearica]|nr:HNH endonuclease [Ferrimonas balearica]
MVTGADADTIDHINGDKSDNRWSNLRSVSQRQNNMNRPTFSNNTTGHRGVTPMPYGQWKVQIGHSYVGAFNSFDEAVSARTDAEARLGYHENHGRTNMG